MTLALWVTLSLLALTGYALAVLGVPRWARRRMEIDALMASKDWSTVEREKNREWMREIMEENGEPR